MSAGIEAKVTWNGDKVTLAAFDTVKSSGYELALIVEGEAIDLCAVDKGWLRGSIMVAGAQSTGLKGGGTGTAPSSYTPITKPNDPEEFYVGTSVEYAPYVEFGTIHTEAQPFLRPAADRAMGKQLEVVRKWGKYYFRDYLQDRL